MLIKHKKSVHSFINTVQKSKISTNSKILLNIDKVTKIILLEKKV